MEGIDALVVMWQTASPMKIAAAQAHVRWHDVYHVFEIIEADVGGRMFSEGWVTKTAVKRFTQTANSRRAIGVR